jgi:hypothetical protein
MGLPSYTVNAFDDILITVTKHADNKFHFKFDTLLESNKFAVVHEFFSSEELTIENAFKRAYSDLAHWVGVTSDMDHLSRNDALRLLMKTGADLYNEKIFKDLKDAEGSFDYNGIIINWSRKTGPTMDTTFEAKVRDNRNQDMEADDYQLGIAVISKVVITTKGNEDNLSPRDQYELYMKAFDNGADR